ncbi:MAG TPA: hypothetical protein VJK03_00690 [Candidatus Nanoarchaeia archaeon]|nr:hypothetical protein [Candidatus Nanoarchaeia archaeon]
MELEYLLNQKGLVHQTPKPKEIIERAKALNHPVKLFYGETYDSQGNPIDSMKYYFFVSMLSKSLNEEGHQTDPMVLVADVAACRNVSSDLNNRYIELGGQRAKFVGRVNDTYNLGLNIIKMSDYLFTQEFQTHLEEIVELCKGDDEIMRKIERTVPESKLEIERKKGFAYSFDEIGTIIDFDIKVGPPREDLYDDVARRIARIQNKKSLMSLFLTPTFPLGKSWAYFFANEGIEDHGITAYKVGSKQLQDHRIIVGKTPSSDAERLIDASFVPSSLDLPNPTLDIGIIAEMARINLEGGDFNLYERVKNGQLNDIALKEEVKDSLNKYILSKF